MERRIHTRDSKAPLQGGSWIHLRQLDSLRQTGSVTEYLERFCGVAAWSFAVQQPLQ